MLVLTDVTVEGVKGGQVGGKSFVEIEGVLEALVPLILTEMRPEAELPIGCLIELDIRPDAVDGREDCEANLVVQVLDAKVWLLLVCVLAEFVVDAEDDFFKIELVFKFEDEIEDIFLIDDGLEATDAGMELFLDTEDVIEVLMLANERVGLVGGP